MIPLPHKKCRKSTVPSKLLHWLPWHSGFETVEKLPCSLEDFVDSLPFSESCADVTCLLPADLLKVTVLRAKACESVCFTLRGMLNRVCNKTSNHGANSLKQYLSQQHPTTQLWQGNATLFVYYFSHLIHSLPSVPILHSIPCVLTIVSVISVLLF